MIGEGVLTHCLVAAVAPAVLVAAAVASELDVVFTLDAVQVLTLAVGTILPILVALVTTKVTSRNVKGWLLATLAAAMSVGAEALTAAQDAEPFDLGRGLVLGLGVWVVAVASYYGIWSPSGATDAANDVPLPYGREDTPPGDDEHPPHHA